MSNEHAAMAFVNNTPAGADFEFSACETGTHLIDGRVAFNDRGITQLEFKSISDFAGFRFLGLVVEHTESHYVGERSDDGEISWLHEPYQKCDIDQEDDGSGVYTLPVLVSPGLDNKGSK